MAELAKQEPEKSKLKEGESVVGFNIKLTPMQMLGLGFVIGLVVGYFLRG